MSRFFVRYDPGEMAVAVGVAPASGIPLLRERSTAVSATTADLGLADVYRITEALQTLTISTIHLAVDGRLIEIFAEKAGGGGNTVVLEGGKLIGASASLSMSVNNSSVVLRTLGGNCQVRST